MLGKILVQPGAAAPEPKINLKLISGSATKEGRARKLSASVTLAVAHHFHMGLAQLGVIAPEQPAPQALHRDDECYRRNCRRRSHRYFRRDGSYRHRPPRDRRRNHQDRRH